ncbi:MAG: DUF3237 family protein [Dehalococcoidia bacterium]
MTSSTVGLGELIYEVTVNFTEIKEYGVSMEAVASGQVAPPPQGARFDVSFAGASSGPKIKGTITGVDYLNLRADGKAELHIHAELTDEAGEKISFFADGVATPREGTPIFDLRENATLTTASPAYAWVNALQIGGWEPWIPPREW